jgi:hypothetical protein
MSELIKQPVLLGTDAVAKANPDGYTIIATEQ